MGLRAAPTVVEKAVEVTFSFGTSDMKTIPDLAVYGCRWGLRSLGTVHTFLSTSRRKSLAKALACGPIWRANSLEASSGKFRNPEIPEFGHEKLTRAREGALLEHDRRSAPVWFAWAFWRVRLWKKKWRSPRPSADPQLCCLGGAMSNANRTVGPDEPAQETAPPNSRGRGCGGSAVTRAMRSGGRLRCSAGWTDGWRGWKSSEAVIT